MLKQLLTAFQVPESELSRVQLLLTTILRGATAVAVTLAIVSLAFMLMGQPNWFWLVGVVLAAILFGLTRLNQGGKVSLSVNLLLAVITIYAVFAEPMGFPEPRLHTLIYAVPIVMVALLLPTAAVLYWGIIVASVILLRVLILSLMLGLFCRLSGESSWSDHYHCDHVAL
jgi:hypothetical protein